MDVNKNSYTLGFAAIMVIIVAALLSVAAIVFKEPQERNVELEKKQNILKSVAVEVSREESETVYYNFIKEELVIDSKGEIKEGIAFDVDLAKELKKDISEQNLPLYIAEVDGETKYIIPLRGKGLWGPIWGFIALNEDLNTVYGAIFDHSKETPGLGAEINTGNFQIPFAGKTIFEGIEFVSISVIKSAEEDNMHAVNGISGGTITSNGVSDMIKERLEKYLPYFENQNPETKIEKEVEMIFSDSTLTDSLTKIQEESYE